MIKKILILLLGILFLALILLKNLLSFFIRPIFGLLENVFKSIKNSHSIKEAWQNFTSKKYARSRLSIPQEVIALMAKIAICDGKVSRLEVEYMSDTILQMIAGLKRSRLPNSMVERAKTQLFEIANSAKKDEHSVLFYTRTLQSARPQIRQGAFMQIIAFSLLDGLSDSTLALLKQIGGALGFTEAQIEQLIESVKGGALNQNGYDQTKDPYEILNCQASDEFSIIKKSYRRLVKQNHPDYMQGKGKNQQEIEATTLKMQEINAAYAEIKRLTGKR